MRVTGTLWYPNSWLITETTTKWLSGHKHTVDTLDKGMIHTWGRMKQDSVRFHHVTQNGAQFKSYDLFIPRIFNLILSEHSSDHGEWNRE